MARASPGFDRAPEPAEDDDALYTITVDARPWLESESLAKAFGVSGPAISQWLGQTPTDEELRTRSSARTASSRTVGKTPPAAHPARPAAPWSEQGECLSLVRKTTGRIARRLDFPVTVKELSPEERDAMTAIVQDLKPPANELLTLTEDRLGTLDRREPAR
jgi:hypothetical protein